MTDWLKGPAHRNTRVRGPQIRALRLRAEEVIIAFAVAASEVAPVLALHARPRGGSASIPSRLSNENGQRTLVGYFFFSVDCLAMIWSLILS